MNWHKKIWNRIVALFRKSKLEAELDEELLSHIELRTQENIEAGMQPEKARREALRQFGWPESIRENCRDQRGTRWFENLVQDVRFGARQMRKNPGFTIVAVLTLSLGIGANSAIFSVVNGVLLRPLAYKEPDRIVTVLHNGWNPVSPADFIDWRAQSSSFSILAAAEAWGGTLTGADQPEALSGIRLGEGMFELLGVPPAIGRTFQTDDYAAGRERVLVLSHRLWQRRFAGDRGILGKNVTLDTQSYTIVGVMPPEFQFAPFWTTKSEMWAPLTFAGRSNARDGNSLRIFGRLKPGVLLQQAQADMDTICRRLAQTYPDTNTGRTVRVDALLDKVVGNIRQGLLVLSGAVGFVLLIACANVANLLLVRSSAREKEMAIRGALGAGRWRTIRQLLTESLLLASLAAVLGLGIGYAGVSALKGYLEGNASSYNIRLPRVHEIAMDSHALLFTLGVALLTGVVFGLAPALQAARPDLQLALKESGRGASLGRQTGRLRSLLVIAEVAIAFMMLAGAGLLMRSFVRLALVDPGFNPKNLLSMTVSLAGQGDYTGPKREAFYQELFQKIETLPGVRSASAINHLPLAGDEWGCGITIEGRPLPARGEGINAVYRVCRPNYFATMGISLLHGRDFSEQDRIGSPNVVIINENLARTQFAGEDPVGKRITLDDARGNPNWMTIVGVVKDAKQDSWTDNVSAEIYLPWLQSTDYIADTAGHFSYMTLVIRTASNPRSLTDSVQHAVWSLDKSAPVASISTMEEVVANAVWQHRFHLILMGIFAGLAVVLAGVGIYGVMACSVAQRTQEIGIRLALGARRWDLFRLVVGQGMRLALGGLAIGLLCALAMARVMSSLLFQVNTTDVITFSSVFALLTIVSFLAVYLPARRATRVDPMVALRSE